MCGCKDIELGSYKNQSALARPAHMLDRGEGTTSKTICVDNCLVAEVLQLWSLGIRTTGCCCGHNKLDGFIGVIEEDIGRVMHLGYEPRLNETDPLRHDSFHPLSVPRVSSA